MLRGRRSRRPEPAVERGAVRRGVRLLAAAAVTVGLLAPALPVKADPVLCVTLAYQVLNQPREYVFDDDCVVPSPWNPQIGDGWNCHWLVIGEACYEFAISHPMP